MAHQDVLNTEQAATLLRVSPGTVRDQARHGRLPGRKVGRQWRFSRQALLEWLGNGRRGAAPVDEEPLSIEDLGAIREGIEAIRRGDFTTLEEYERRRQP